MQAMGGARPCRAWEVLGAVQAVQVMGGLLGAVQGMGGARPYVRAVQVMGGARGRAGRTCHGRPARGRAGPGRPARPCGPCMPWEEQRGACSVARVGLEACRSFHSRPVCGHN
jgi:hypothetical protein